MASSMKMLSTFVIFVVVLFPYYSCNIASPGRPLGEGGLKNTDSNHQPIPYALSATYLTDLSKREEKVHATMARYLKSLEDRLTLVKAYLADYDDSQTKVKKDENGTATGTFREIEVSASPIRSYKMISRFSEDLRTIVRVRDDAESTLLDQMMEIEGLHNWPTEDDAYDIIDSILRIQFFYNLNLTEFVEGNINGTQTGVTLTSRQCWNIAQFAVHYQFFTLALEWFDVTKSKLRQENQEDRPSIGLSEEIVIAAERSTREAHDRHYDDLVKSGSQFIFTRRIGKGPELPITVRQHLMNTYLGREFCSHVDYSFINFVAVCNGHNFQTKEEKSKLRCWLERDRHPYFKVNPLKMELLHETPSLVQIHDFIGEHWIQVLKRTASPTLKRPPPRKDVETTPRTAIYSWLPDEDIKEIDLIKKIESVTGINVATQKASDQLQIASYSFGGHVGLHVDSLDKNAYLDKRGDRILTLLMYLNDVERGGLTVFPMFGTSVKPLKGSAVLWYNSLKNGKVDRRTVHAACPLILGQKWIATKWTHLNENMFKWPCSTDPEA